MSGFLAVGEINAEVVEQAAAEVAPKPSIESLASLSQVEKFLHKHCNLSRVQAKALTGKMKALASPAPAASNDIDALTDLLRAGIAALQEK